MVVIMLTKYILNKLDSSSVLVISSLLLGCVMSTSLAAMDEKDSQDQCKIMRSLSSKGNYNPYYGNFEFLKKYNIFKLHDLGYTGDGYTVAILENEVDEHHPALEGKIEFVNPYNTKRITSPAWQEHGNHVSPLIVGNSTSEFSGGVAPKTYGYVVKKNPDNGKYDVTQAILDAIEIGAQKSHLVNLSGGLVGKMGKQDLTSEEIERLKNILIQNDAILIITASNEHRTIQIDNDLAYLYNLTTDPDLAKRILIVGNLEYKNQQTLIQEEENINIWKEKIFPKLDDFINNSQLKGYDSVVDDVTNLIQQNDILKDGLTGRFFYNMREIRSGISPSEKINTLSDEEVKQQIVNETLEYHCKNSQKLSTYVQENGEEKLKDALHSLLETIKTSVSTENYVSPEQQLESLEQFLDNDLLTSFSPLRNHFINGWKDKSEFQEIVTHLQSYFFDFQLQRIPEDKDDTGICVSTRAGVAKDHFILTYGTNIRSGWSKKGYENKTGSSEAAPITTGILILLHEYLKSVGQEKSWVELLEFVKRSARPLGNPESFGLGMLNVEKLFEGIL